MNKPVQEIPAESGPFHPICGDEEPLPGLFNNPFYYTPHPLCITAAKELQQSLSSSRFSTAFREEISHGKMFGVLVVRDPMRGLGYLAGYSGQICGRSDWPGFVPAIFDYLQPQDYFKEHEAEISAINRHIAQLEQAEEFRKLQTDYDLLLKERDEVVAAKEETKKTAKVRRDRRRSKGPVSEREHAAMVRESQFLKAEVRRARQHYALPLAERTKALEAYLARIAGLKRLRKEKSDALQQWLFRQFLLYNARGEQENLLDVFRAYFSATHSRFPRKRIQEILPPAGSGECCEPKLLQYAFRNGQHPLCMAMFWWGTSPKTEIRHALQFYPACNGKCKPILEWMLQGLDVADNPLERDLHQDLEIIYADADLIVVNKPSGMLTVPGKSQRESVLSIIREKYPDTEGPVIVHRLDMATSGLLVLARNKAAYIHLQKQFRDHTIRKQYRAVLEPGTAPKVWKGVISLPLSPDPLDRPRQKVDFAHGKTALTVYEFISSDEVVLRPLTGRTHQLRVHCAHPDGLSRPIKGDELYGRKSDRLYLHAESLEFTHPVTGKRMKFTRKT